MKKYYSKQDGLNYIFQCRWEKAYSITEGNDDSRKEFPNDVRNRYKEYHAFEEKMNQEWHPEVNLGAAVSDGQLLTDHGVGHIRSVISHAADILKDNRIISGYEMFLLLVSIHLHDVGNIYGRSEHERKIAEIIDAMGSDLALDISEKTMVAAIATAHGGYTDSGDKDTISQVMADQQYDGITIHIRELAAVLRFADEISDDWNRANANHIKIPEENMVYHAYSEALSPISILGDSIKFEFKIPYELTQNKVGKGKGKSVYLYDEIRERLAKCMRELEYCKKYANGWIGISTLDVVINVMKKGSTSSCIGEMRRSFRLTLHGYPDKTKSGFDDYLDKDDSGRKEPYKDAESLSMAIKDLEKGK